uniref:NADH-ubiquinone oxidoreductase chain 6 n=1 Tax=Nola angustipennis TaxID=3003639 RepID=A0A9E8Z453_9NEOP|nr:NADH dehydrogenase subunit 6 [Nola angustipennis]WAL04258.1 NADH dehydrogenase subunit 6 [Nola angustipennis]
MMKLFFSFSLMLNSSIMLFMNNPLSMGIMILTQTLLTCLISGMLIKTYWFSYILFLTFLGGLLVLFIYVSSVVSNELFNPSMNMKIFFIMNMLLMMMLQIIYMNNLTWMNLSINDDMINFNMMTNLINYENKINLNKLYNNQTFLMMMMMIIYLFITLISVIKITNIFYGPLRSSN